MEGVNLVVMTEDQLNGILNKLERIEQMIVMSEVVKEDRIMSAPETAGYLGIQLQTLYGWARQRKIPHRRVGSNVYFSKNELDDWSRRDVIEEAKI
jgi:excisionase family DNA binding protein